MKRKILLPLLLALLFLASFALADTSVMRTETTFSMNIDGLNTTEAHVLALHAGDELYVSSVVTAGKLSVVIKKDGGEVIYTGSDESEPGFTVEIPGDGHYRISVTGDGATGNLWISVKQKLSSQGSNEMPARRIHVQSLLGYALECDVDYFTYTAATGMNDADVFQCQSDAEAKPTAINLAILREGKSLADASAALLETEGMEELSPTVIDFRAARVFRLTQEDGSDPKFIQDYTLIECGENEVLLANAAYYEDAEDAGLKMRQMVENLQFTR